MSVNKRGAKCVFYMNFTVNGQRIYKSTGKFTKKEAKQVEANERQKMLNEATMSPQERNANMFLEEAAKQVYEAKWKNNKDQFGPKTRCKRLIDLLGNIPLSKIDDDVVSEMVRKLDSTKIKPATVNRFLATLKTILKFKRQPCDHIKLRKESKGRIRVVSKDEETSVVNLLRTTEHSKRRWFYYDVADLVEVLIDTGMRLSEALTLATDDINFDSNLIHIWINKGDRPRSVPMTKRVASILKRRTEGDIKNPFNLTTYQSDKAWAWAREQIGLKDDTECIIHALRHTCASRLVNAGIDLYVVKEWLGHSSIQVTERYAHLAPHKLAHAATILDELS
jgi:integrase